MEELLDPIVPVIGKEGSVMVRDSCQGRKLGVLTSGGDSQGMNSALRSVVRVGLYLGCKVYLILEGYQGMIDGDIVEATWNGVSDIIQRGGTIIGSTRSEEFYERSGRLKACENLCKLGISNLICIGGDGTLIGAHQFKLEWPTLLAELVANKKVSQSVLTECPTVSIVGLVASIYNDFCGTDMTIGTDSALHRILESVDAVVSTAQSHQRTFVIEVMGRHSGYLALIAGLATEADWIFIPEWPPASNWADLMCGKLAQMREGGSRLNIIMVSEGAIDQNGNRISSEDVRKAIKEKLHYDTRTTVLGHVQRGGSPSAFDRLLGLRLGADAVVASMESTATSEPCVISIDGNQMVRVPLMQCVERTNAVQKAMEDKNWNLAVQLRGKSFERNLQTYKLLAKIYTPKERDNLSAGHTFNLAVMNIGAPACGMNAAVRSFVRMGLYHNCNVFGIYNSFEVIDAIAIRGRKVAEKLEEYNIHGLLMIGGFEAYHCGLIMFQNREKFKAFRIPIVVIPCTISNNVPGTSFSLGSDTSINEICQIVDKIKQSATGTKRRVFIIETMGSYCGYLATLSGLASGADSVYVWMIFEEKFAVDDLVRDVNIIADKMERGVPRYIVIRNENASSNYTTKFIHALYQEEAKGRFSTRVNVLGHMQQGRCPSPFDRNQATKLSAMAAEFLVAQMLERLNETDGDSKITNDKRSATLLGIIDRRITFTPLVDLEEKTDFEHRVPLDQWWLKLRPLLRLLAQHH